MELKNIFWIPKKKRGIKKTVWKKNKKGQRNNQKKKEMKSLMEKKAAAVAAIIEKEQKRVQDGEECLDNMFEEFKLKMVSFDF